MQIFKIKYAWYEGEEREEYLGKNVDKKKFEEDIIKAKNFAESLIGKEIETGSYLGKGYAVECLPEFYDQIIWFLTNKEGYEECEIDDSEYKIESDSPEKKIIINRLDTKIKRVVIN